MTCREFKHEAAGLSAADLTRLSDPASRHAAECQACGSWLEKQRSLAASMQSLRAQTSGLEAGINVERALLRVFRQGKPADSGAVSAEVAAGGVVPAEFAATARHPKRAPGSTPIAWRMSQWFEVGAYAAAAAAIVVGIFLGVHLLRPRAGTAAAQSQTAPAMQPNAAASTSSSTGRPLRAQLASSSFTPKASRATRPKLTLASATAMEDSQNDDAGYVALMLCDPLSCSDETQVVRMELPESQDAPAQMADVVVGLDGIVRAVRIVN